MAVITTAGFRCLNGDEERVIKVLDPWPPRWTTEVRAAIALLMFATLGEENRSIYSASQRRAEREGGRNPKIDKWKVFLTLFRIRRLVSARSLNSFLASTRPLTFWSARYSHRRTILHSPRLPYVAETLDKIVSFALYEEQILSISRDFNIIGFLEASFQSQPSIGKMRIS